MLYVTKINPILKDKETFVLKIMYHMELLNYLGFWVGAYHLLVE